MIKEFEAQVAVLVMAATAVTAPTSARRSLVDEEDEITSKVLSKVLNIFL